VRITSVVYLQSVCISMGCERTCARACATLETLTFPFTFLYAWRIVYRRGRCLLCVCVCVENEQRCVCVWKTSNSVSHHPGAP
jgi:hypothetical protein